MPMNFKGFNNNLGALVEYKGRAALAMEDWTIIASFDLREHLEAIKWLEMRKEYAGPNEVLPDLDKFMDATLRNGVIQNMDTLDIPLSPSPKEIANLYQNNTSVLNSTVNILHGSSLQSIVDKLQMGIDWVKNNKGSTEVPEEMAIEFSFLADHIRLSEAAIQEALVSAYQGQLSPRILTIKQLEKEILNIQAHLPSRRRLFFERFTTSDIYQNVKISTHRMENHIVFKISVPLVDVELFNLYRLTPIPRVLENEKIELVDMEVPYLGINDHLDRHFPLHDLRDCTEMMPEKFICRTQITYGKDDARVPCSLAAIRNDTTGSCETRQMDGRSLWTPLLVANSWMVALTQELTLMGVCSDDRQELKINGSGILHIRIQQDKLNENEGVKIAIIAVCPLVVLVFLFIALAWFYSSYRKKLNIQRRMEDPLRGTKNETKATNLPLLEKETDP
ncbi:uncharacterized protein Iris [Drosophila bipectinata]|uniref:uncharacterized protein Iris n=1 Tax=Drosophila bipectinata TaxID=42026 RepID=UPI001C88EED0|nr:uncharacterized protein LOC108132409 [Drosophila bipectinata]